MADDVALSGVAYRLRGNGLFDEPADFWKRSQLLAQPSHILTNVQQVIPVQPIAPAVQPVIPVA